MSARGHEAMALDMAEQPAVIARLIERREQLILEVSSCAPEKPAGIVLVARGSSDYAAVFGRYLLEAATGRPVALAAPSLHTVYGFESDVRGWLAVAASQSGRTPEITTMLEALRAAGASAVAITNDASSPLAGAAQAVIALEAGEERAVPATKTFTAQLAAFALLAEAIGRAPFPSSDWEPLPGALERVLADPGPADAVAQALGEADEIACVARGFLLCVALEAALKLREAAALRGEGWSAADFRHGPMTVVGSELPVLAVRAAGPAERDVRELVAALRGRGASVFEISGDADAALPLPERPGDPLAALPATVRAQQLALALARRRGVDPDHPRGLSKVTPTV